MKMDFWYAFHYYVLTYLMTSQENNTMLSGYRTQYSSPVDTKLLNME